MNILETNLLKEELAQKVLVAFFGLQVNHFFRKIEKLSIINKPLIWV